MVESLRRWLGNGEGLTAAQASMSNAEGLLQAWGLQFGIRGRHFLIVTPTYSFTVCMNMLRNQSVVAYPHMLHFDSMHTGSQPPCSYGAGRAAGGISQRALNPESTCTISCTSASFTMPDHWDRPLYRPAVNISSKVEDNSTPGIAGSLCLPTHSRHSTQRANSFTRHHRDHIKQTRGTSGRFAADWFPQFLMFTKLTGWFHERVSHSRWNRLFLPRSSVPFLRGEKLDLQYWLTWFHTRSACPISSSPIDTHFQPTVVLPGYCNL